MRIVHAADIHLDSPLSGMARRQPGLEALARTCTRDAFRNLVDDTIASEADALLIAGDLYDAEQRNYETGLFFAREMQRLGRPCIVIHGNHDAASQISKSLQPPPNVTILPARRPDTVYLPELGLAVHGPGHCQRFVAMFSAVRNLFVPSCSVDTALGRHIHRVRAFAQWNAATEPTA